MLGTVGRRLLAAIPLLWGVCTLLFVGIHLLPGDVSDVFVDPDAPDLADRIRSNLGLDRPLPIQYAKWLRSTAVLDFQYSLVDGRPVTTVLAEALPKTLLLSAVALLLVFGVGTAVGLFVARRAGSPVDRVLTGGALLVYSTPAFWLALMLLLLFADRLALLPASGVASVNAEFLPPFERFLDRLGHLVLPAIALSAAPAAGVSRFVRESLVDTLGENYVRTARAKGLTERAVVRRHALRNALLPLITLLGLYLPLLVGGSVLVETVFGWPGMGRLLVRAILQQDYPVVLGGAFLLTTVVVLGNLLADLLSTAADPRLRDTKAGGGRG